MRMFCFIVLLAALLLPAGCAIAQEKKAASGPDPAKVERYLRRYFSWPDEVKVVVGPYKPSPVPGLLETTVQLSSQGQKQDTVFLITSDGQYLMQGPPLALNSDPLAAKRAKMRLDEAPSLGSPLAPVVVVEFSDLQCGFCKGMAGVLHTQMMPQYNNQVRLVFKNFPLPFHPWATPAALLGHCIFKRHGDAAFWMYEQWTFENQAQLTPENFKEKAFAYAKQKGMDTSQLAACMDQPETKAVVERDLAEGRALGVTGTPTLFINGRTLVGNQPLPQLKQAIEAELAYARGK